MRESKIERELTEKVESLGGVCWKFVPVSTTGIPDRIVMMPMQRIWFVETKAPKGTVSPKQGFIHKMLTRLGFKVRVIYNLEEVDEFIIEIASQRR